MAKFARNRILVGLLILISALRAQAGLVQTNSGTSGTSVLTYSVGFTSPLTASDLILVAIGTNSVGSTVSSITDTLGNTFAPATNLSTTAFTPLQISEQIWWTSSKASGADTLTVPVSQAANLHMIVAEYSGVATVNPVDATSIGNSGTTTSTAVDSGPLATSTAGDLLFGHVVTGSLNHTFTAGTGYTIRQTSPSGPSAIEDQWVSATGGNHATFTLDVADYWLCTLVALKPAVPSSGTMPVPAISGAMDLSVQNVCSATLTNSCVNGLQITHIDPATGTKVTDATVAIPLNVTYTVN